jgi:hypothetical protein
VIEFEDAHRKWWRKPPVFAAGKVTTASLVNALSYKSSRQGIIEIAKSFTKLKFRETSHRLRNCQTF